METRTWTAPWWALKPSYLVVCWFPVFESPERNQLIRAFPTFPQSLSTLLGRKRFLQSQWKCNPPSSSLAFSEQQCHVGQRMQDCEAADLTPAQFCSQSLEKVQPPGLNLLLHDDAAYHQSPGLGMRRAQPQTWESTSKDKTDLLKRVICASKRCITSQVESGEAKKWNRWPNRKENGLQLTLRKAAWTEGMTSRKASQGARFVFWSSPGNSMSRDKHPVK